MQPVEAYSIDLFAFSTRIELGASKWAKNDATGSAKTFHYRELHAENCYSKTHTLGTFGTLNLKKKTDSRIVSFFCFYLTVF